MNRKQLCADFARQKGLRGRASNLYYEGRVMYSYGEHFPIAVILKDGRAAVNKDRYSSSTSRHQSAVRYALSMEGYKLLECETEQMKEFAYKHLNVPQRA